MEALQQKLAEEVRVCEQLKLDFEDINHSFEEATKLYMNANERYKVAKQHYLHAENMVVIAKNTLLCFLSKQYIDEYLQTTREKDMQAKKEQQETEAKKQETQWTLRDVYLFYDIFIDS